MNLREYLRGKVLFNHAVTHWRTTRLRKTHPHGIVPEKPHRVIIEPTNACNLACTYCGNKSMVRPKTYLAMPLYERLIAEMTELGISRITLHTIGEPTLHKQLPEMIRVAKRAGIIVSLSTNGTTLTEKNVRELVDSGPDIVNLSVDAADSEKIKALRVGLDPEKFYAGMQRLKRIRDEAGPIVDSPWGEVRLPSIVATVVITHMWDRAEEKAWFERFGPYVDDVELHWPNSHAGYVSEGPHQRKGILPRKLRDRIYGAVRTICPYPWDSLFLLSNGEISACHFDFDARLTVGRYPEQSLMELWNSQRMMSLRKAHMDFDFSDWEVCGECDGALYVNRTEDHRISQRVKKRNGFVSRRDMWLGRSPMAQRESG